jgi:predicted RNase H-like HicB family nuclease
MGSANRTMATDRYEVIIYWSDDDSAYVAEVPELPGCIAHGATRQAALDSIGEAMGLWLDTAREFGDPVPVPKGRRLVLA